MCYFPESVSPATQLPASHNEIALLGARTVEDLKAQLEIIKNNPAPFLPPNPFTRTSSTSHEP